MSKQHRYVRRELLQFGASINVYQQWKLLPSFTAWLGDYPGLYKLFRESCFGHFLEFNVGGYFASHLMHALLAHEIIPPGATALSDTEIWFGLGQRACRFGQREFCLITGLKFFGDDGIDPSNLEHVRDGILDRYFGSGEVLVERLAHRYRDGGFLSTVDAYKVGLVTFAACIVLGYRPQARVDTWLFDLVEDVDQFNKFPWGRYCFQMTRYYAQQGPRAPSDGSDLARYHLPGFIWALQIWAMEAIPSIANLYREARSPTTRWPRFLNWAFPRRNFTLSRIFTNDIEAAQTLEPTQEELEEQFWRGVDTPLTLGTFHFTPPETLVPRERLTQSRKRKTASSGKSDVPKEKRPAQMPFADGTQGSQTTSGTLSAIVPVTTIIPVTFQSRKRKAASSSKSDVPKRKRPAQMPFANGTQRSQMVSGTLSTIVPVTFQSDANKEGEKDNKKKDVGENNEEKKNKKKKCKWITLEDLDCALDRVIETLYQRLTSYIDHRLSGHLPSSPPPPPPPPPTHSDALPPVPDDDDSGG